MFKYFNTTLVDVKHLSTFHLNKRKVYFNTTLVDVKPLNGLVYGDGIKNFNTTLVDVKPTKTSLSETTF